MYENTIRQAEGHAVSINRVGRHVPVSRRKFLKSSSALFGALVAGTPLATLAPSLAWAVELNSLDTNSGKTLLQFARTLYPHAHLPDAIYAVLVKDLDQLASADPAAAAQLREGIGLLDQVANGRFLDANASTQFAAAKAIENTSFFATVRQGDCTYLAYQ